MSTEQHPSTTGQYVAACEELARTHGAFLWLPYAIEPLGAGTALYLVYVAAHEVLGDSEEVYAALSAEQAAYRAAEAVVDGSVSRCPSCNRFTALTDIADDGGPVTGVGLCWFYYSRQRARFLASCRPLALVDN